MASAGEWKPRLAPSAGKLETGGKRGENIKLVPSAGKMKPLSSAGKMKPLSSAKKMKPVPRAGKHVNDAERGEHEAGIKHGTRFAASQVTSGCGFASDWLKIVFSLIDLHSTLTETTTTSNETSILEP